MKIKLLQSIAGISKGTILPVRKITFDQHKDLWAYQVIDGPHLGLGIVCNSLDTTVVELPQEKAYTEKQWNEREDYYIAQLDREREQKKRAQELVNGLTEKLNAKNKQIQVLDSCVNILALVAKQAAVTIEKLRNLEIEK